MAIPRESKMLLPILKLLEDGQPHTIVEVRDKIAEYLNVTPDERKEVTPGVKRRRYDVNVCWAVSRLRHAGFLENTKLGKFKLTTAGRQILANPPPEINRKFLEEHSQKYSEWINRSKKTSRL